MLENEIKLIILCVSGENKGKLAVHPLLGEKILYHKCVGGNTHLSSRTFCC